MTQNPQEAAISHVLAQSLKQLLRDETGQDLIEYALVAALVALGAATALKGLTNKIDNSFSTVSSNLTSAV